MICKRCLVFYIFFLFYIPASFSLEQPIYIWQRDWNVDIEESRKELQEHTNHFLLLCGDFKCKSNKIDISQVPIKWSYFDQKKSKITLVFRINTKTSQLLKENNEELVINNIVNVLADLLKAAETQDINIAGIQFDYDCPTSQLKNYSKFIRKLKQEMPNFSISITALPAWLTNKDFKNLVTLSSYYVLQLHSFEIPDNMTDALKIFPKDKAFSYYKKASKYNVPFYISLPTYGYEAAFSQEGNFLGLRAEGTRVLWGEDIQYKAVRTNPLDVLSFLKEIRKEPIDNFLGICWFRMPLKSDEFNWDISTLKAVMQGRKPKISFELETVAREKGLFDIYLSNTGEQNIAKQVWFTINWNGETTFLYDVLGNYSFSPCKEFNGLTVNGYPPEVGKKVLICWFKGLEEPKETQINSLVLSEVKIYEDE